ncbi:MAG: beta-galactosidase, partial [Candidatus Hydrogenedentes bacterium]|nr:beta-galactosidase [Candidatus Hydrogenedentota bacterium]
MNAIRIVCAALMLGVLLGGIAMAQWKPVEGQLMTRWAETVSPDNVWPEYPRPQMTRENWQNLNGLWEYAITSNRDKHAPETWEGDILVPFAIESALSGVKEAVLPDQKLWYRRTFTVPADWGDQRVLLHFGAVDWECTVYVNGKYCGRHQGGYDPFSFDITGALNPAGEQELIVAAWDPTNQGYQPRGKQVLDPQGIWYTAVTGIWQTV